VFELRKNQKSGVFWYSKPGFGWFSWKKIEVKEFKIIVYIIVEAVWSPGLII
jgi:hypothetical protein